MNKPDIHTNITDISVSKNGLNHAFRSTSFYFKGKILIYSDEMQKCYAF